MPEGWQPDSKGMATFVGELPKILKRMLGKKARKPKVLFTDRGAGMYIPRTGEVTGKYKAAIKNHGFRLYSGNNAKEYGQPSDVADILLHKTAIACFKMNLKRTRPQTKPWLETHEMFTKRVAGVVKEANAKCDFRELCCEYPTRLEKLKEKKGDRLRK